MASTDADLDRQVTGRRDQLALSFLGQVDPAEYDGWADKDDDEREEIAREAFDAAILDAYAVVHVGPNQPNGRDAVQHVVLVLTVGGPHVEAEIHDDGRMIVRGYWGGSKAEAWGTASAEVAEWAEWIADSYGVTA